MSKEEIMNVDNWYVLAIMLYAPNILTPEQAWAAYAHGQKSQLKLPGVTESKATTCNRIAYEMRRKGAKIAEIAEYFGASKGTVASYATRGKRATGL